MSLSPIRSDKVSNHIETLILKVVKLKECLTYYDWEQGKDIKAMIVKDIVKYKNELIRELGTLDGIVF